MSSDLAPPSVAAEADPSPSDAESEVSSIDLIIELYKRDVDRTLIMEQLKKTPAQRGADLQRFYDFAMEMRRAVAKATSL